MLMRHQPKGTMSAAIAEMVDALERLGFTVTRPPGPLAQQPCPCESSLCPHHDVIAGEQCPNRAEGDVIGRDPIMLYLGPCCRACAESMAASGGADYVMPPFGTAAEYIG